VTEADYYTCTDTQELLRFLQGRASDRKLRLFAVACLRRVWSLLRDERSRQAVEVAERVAEGRASPADLIQVEAEAEAVHESTRPAAEEARRSNGLRLRSGVIGLPAGDAIAISCATLAVAGACRGKAAEAAGQAAYGVTMTVMRATAPLGLGEAAWDASWSEVDEANAALLRDLFGPLPFRPVHIDPTWRTPAVLALANTIYDERRWAEMPILGDALSEAGCTDAEVLDHCRGPAEHARGCWLIDLVLERT
jgi:hypothetical protein